MLLSVFERKNKKKENRELIHKERGNTGYYQQLF